MTSNEDRYVQPFYLKMMGNWATKNGAELVGPIAMAARLATAGEVVSLLEGPWRPRVMGAWLSVRQTDPAVNRALLLSLRTSLGWLTLPPLATAAVAVMGLEAVDALKQYIADNLNFEPDSAGFASAALEHLQCHDGAGPLPNNTSRYRKDLQAMLGVAELLRTAKTRQVD